MYKWNLTIHHSYFIVWSNTGTTIYNGISIENNFHVSLETCNVLTGRSIRKVHMATNKLPKGLLSMKYTWPQVQTLSDRFVNYDFTHGHKYMYKQLQKWSAKYEGTQSHKYKLCLTGLPIMILHIWTFTNRSANFKKYGCKYKQLQKWSAKYEGTHAHKYKHCQIDLLPMMIAHMATM